MKNKLTLIICFLMHFFLCQAFIQLEAAASVAVLLTPFPMFVNAGNVKNPVDQKWKVIESKYCTILYHPDVTIEKVNRKVKLKFYSMPLDNESYLLKKAEDIRLIAENRLAEQQLAEKFDRLFRRVEEILDMYPNRIHLTIKIYKNQASLNNAYFETFGSPNKEQRISYYIHKYTTIYTTQQVISQEVMAHEIGHAVIDHYFFLLFPEKIKELLAQYVEIHLED